MLLSYLLAQSQDKLLLGEGVSDGRVLVVKAHDFQAVTKQHQIVLLLRNPFDAIWSFFQLESTSSHVGKLEEEIMQRANMREAFFKYTLSHRPVVC